MSSRSLLGSVMASWRGQSPGIRLIRLWLGVTWIYAAWTKASDPGFLSRTGSTYIGKTLGLYAENSPIGFFFRHLIERASTVGIIIMIVEFSIGLATLLYIAPTTVAFIGFTMSSGLWLAATWHVKPYFLGSDSAYAVLWFAYFLTLVGRRRKVDISLDRRGAIRVGSVAVAAAAFAVFGRIFANSTKSTSATSQTVSTSESRRIVKLSDFAIGQSREFAAPGGVPAVLFRTANGVFAYSRICTHQGCSVSYSPQDETLICPCHGGTYDPFDNAKVIAGPPPRPLSSIKVGIEGDWVTML